MHILVLLCTIHKRMLFEKEIVVFTTFYCNIFSFFSIPQRYFFIVFQC